MNEDTEQKRSNLMELLEANKGNANEYLDGILLCVDRAKRLIAVNGPMTIVQNEVNMIQYRALSALSCYELHALLSFAKSESFDKEELNKINPLTPEAQ